jgi:hypothetical protein
MGLAQVVDGKLKIPPKHETDWADARVTSLPRGFYTGKVMKRK